jgi:hypothetical protein
VVAPQVAAPGEVAHVTGYGFPPGRTITLSWRPGLGQVQVTAGPFGTFRTAIVIFPNDPVGRRVLVASAPDVTAWASAPFIVAQQLTRPAPPDQVATAGQH